MCTGDKRLAEHYSKVASMYGGAPVSADGTNMDEYLLSIADKSLDDYNRRHLVAGTANGSTAGFVGHFNNFALHSVAMSLSLADNAVLRHSLNNDGARIVTVNHPLPRSLNTRTNSGVALAAVTGYSFSFNVAFGLYFADVM